ncbi:MAG: hypothetical protein K2K53_06480 [Oscillospiraceae bacterium]|nr:hypothetical protein [Oscillospiraceae bacterium]
MRLPADVAAEFMTLDANVRTMASRCFEENAKRMAVEQPFADFQDKEQRLQAEKLLERVVLE